MRRRKKESVTWKKAKILLMLYVRLLFRNYTYRVKRGLANGLYRKGGLGFIPQVSSLSKEEDFLLNFDFSGKTVYDVGGFEGVFSLFFARAVGAEGKVWVFEPNPHNYRILVKNIELNKELSNVHVLQLALGRQKKTVRLTFDRIEMGRGVIADNGTSQIEASCSGTTTEVAMDSLDNLIPENDLPLPQFVKLDVEGYEAEVLYGMRNTLSRVKPDIFLETHDLLIRENTARNQYCSDIINFFLSNNYSIYHVEARNSINAADTAVFNNGHLFCRVGQE